MHDQYSESWDFQLWAHYLQILFPNLKFEPKGLETSILASGLEFEPWDWDLSLETGIWALRLGFEPQDWDLSFEAGFSASKGVDGHMRRLRRRKNFPIYESLGHCPLCPLSSEQWKCFEYGNWPCPSILISSKSLPLPTLTILRLEWILSCCKECTGYGEITIYLLAWWVQPSFHWQLGRVSNV